MNREPLLSICIPTYNRADWLCLSLKFLLPQITRANGLVELIVSDNCSEDHTSQVAEEAQEYGPFRYHRNESNIGANPNMHLLVSALALGRYIWVLGDDDLVREEAVAIVCEALTAQPDISYMNLNYLSWYPAGPQGFTAMQDYKCEVKRLGNPNLQSRFLPQLKEIVGEDANCFTPIYGSIFRSEGAKAAFQGSLADPPFTTLQSVASHAVYIAENLLEQPAYYIGYPLYAGVLCRELASVYADHAAQNCCRNSTITSAGIHACVKK